MKHPFRFIAIGGAAISAMAAFGSRSGQAQTILPGPAPTIGATSAPPPGSLGYAFLTVYGASTAAPNNTYYGAPGGCPFMVSTANVTQGTGTGTLANITFNPALDYYDTNGYSALTIGGAADYPGFGFVGSETAYLLAYVTLGTAAPSSFVMGIEENNCGAADETTITLSSAATSTSEILNAVPPGVQGSDFYYVTVTGAVAGDVIDIYGTNTTGSTGFSAVTFDAVPEPASASLIGLPLLAMALRRRRNQGR